MAYAGLALSTTIAAAQTSEMTNSPLPGLAMSEAKEDPRAFATKIPELVTKVQYPAGNLLVEQRNAERYLRYHSIDEFNRRYIHPLLVTTRLRKVLSRSGIRSNIAKDLEGEGTTEVSFVNAVSGLVTVDTLQGKQLVMRRFFGAAPEEGLNIVFYDSKGEFYPAYRIHRGIVDELYQVETVPPNPEPNTVPKQRTVTTIRVLKPASIDLTKCIEKLKSPKDIWQEGMPLVAHGDAYRVVEKFRSWAGIEFKTYEQIQVGSLTFTTTYRNGYSPEGRLVGTKVFITRKLLNGKLEKFDPITTENQYDVKGSILLDLLRDARQQENRDQQGVVDAALKDIGNDTPLVKTTIKIPWGRDIVQYRTAAQSGRVVYEQAQERRLNTRFDGDEAVEGVILASNGQIAADYIAVDAQGNRLYMPATSVFDVDERANRIQTVVPSFHDFWGELQDLKIRQDTLLPVVIRHPYLAVSKPENVVNEWRRWASSPRKKETPPSPFLKWLYGLWGGRVGDTQKIAPRPQQDMQINFVPDQRLAEIHYLLPIDPLLNREIAREVVNRPMAGPTLSADDLPKQVVDARKKNPGEFNAVLWRTQKTASPSGLPVGLPLFMVTLYADGRHLVMAYDKETVHDNPIAAGLCGAPIPSTQKDSPNTNWYVYYTFSSDVPGEKLTRIFYNQAGQIVAEDYKHETVQPFRGLSIPFWGRIPSAFYGEERQYYDTCKSWRLPTVSVFLSPHPSGQLAGNGTETVRHTGAVIYAVASPPFSPQQRTELLYWEANGLDSSVVYPFESVYLDERLLSVDRTDLPWAWIVDKQGLGWTGLTVLTLFLVAWSFGTIADWRRRARLWLVSANLSPALRWVVAVFAGKPKVDFPRIGYSN